MPNPPEQSSSTTSVLGPAFLLFFCCSPSPFGTLTSAEFRNDPWWSLLLVVGIELALLTAIIWMFARLVRQPPPSPTWWDAGALLVLGVLQFTNGITRVVRGAPLSEERQGSPDWGYRVDGAVFVVLGLVAAALFIREVVRLRERHGDRADTTR
ncbi:hypothetical protein ABTZ46_25970 [Nocardioides sp. NPDC126508]